MKKQILSSGLAIVAAVALTACGGGQPTSPAASQVPGTPGVSATPVDLNNPPGSTTPVTLTFWDWAPGIDKLVDTWNAKDNGIHISLVAANGGDDAVTKLLTAIKAGSGAPDIMHAEYQMIPTLVSANALADVSKIVDPQVKQEYSAGVWNSVTLGSDAVYAIPSDTGPMAFYYRADLFKKWGVSVPTTWDEYADAAQQVHQKDPKAYLGTFSSNDAGWFTGMTQQAGASWWSMNTDSWSVNINSDQVKKVANYWGGLVEKGVILNTPMYTPEWVAALANGTQVGWLSAAWAPSVLVSDAPKTKGDWQMAPMPQWDPANPATGTWGGSGDAVTTQSQHPAEALQFIQWMDASQEGLTALAALGTFPASDSLRSQVMSTPDFFSNQSDYVSVINEVSQTIQPFTYGPDVNVAYSSYNDAFGKACQQKTQAAFAAAVDTMQSTTVADMKKSGFSVTES